MTPPSSLNSELSEGLACKKALRIDNLKLANRWLRRTFQTAIRDRQKIIANYPICHLNQACRQYVDSDGLAKPAATPLQLL